MSIIRYNEMYNLYEVSGIMVLKLPGAPSNDYVMFPFTDTNDLLSFCSAACGMYYLLSFVLVLVLGIKETTR